MVDFDQNFYVNIDFVLNTQIENIGQNQPQFFLIFFREILQTVVETNMNSYGKKKGALTVVIEVTMYRCLLF